MSTNTNLLGHGLRHAYDSAAGRLPVLRDVALQLGEGEITLLVGPSGGGKTTLLNVLSGLLRPDHGKVFALGEPLWELSDREREAFRRRHCGYIFQGYNLLPGLTVRQQLELVLCWGADATAAEARPRVEEMLELLGLADRAHAFPAQLSGGEKQRVAIGRALIKEPTFCFADEPTSALDWERGQQVVELLCAGARDRGTTVLIVSHDHRLVPYADRVFRLEDGQLSDQSTAYEGVALP